MRVKIISLIAAVILPACAANPPVTVVISAPWDGEAAARQLEPGPNTIKGNGFMRQRGGGVVTCAGQEASLIPATDYAAERMYAIYGSKNSGTARSRNIVFVPDVPEYHKLVRRTKCDSQGNFQFEEVADGDYFVLTRAYWEVRGATQGGLLMQRASVSGGKTVSVVLSM